MADILSGLVNLYKFDDGSGNATDSKSGNTGTVTGATWEPAAKIGPYCLSFDGNDIVDAGDIAALDGLAALTVAGWFKFTNVTTDFVHYVDKRNANDGWVFMTGGSLLGSQGGPLVLIGSGSATPHGRVDSSVIPAGIWAHLAFVYNGLGAADADKLKVYLNAVSQALTFSAAIPATMTASTASLKLGDKASDPTNASFTGQMDDLRTYSRALAWDDIVELYNYRRAAPVNYQDFPNLLLRPNIQHGRVI